MDVIRWQDGEKVFAQAHALAAQVYRSTRLFPISEGKGLVYEMRQATLAISAFLSDALRKDQKTYLFDVLAALERHLGELRRNLAVSRLLTYLSEHEFVELDRGAEALENLLTQWRRDLEEVPELRLEARDAAPRASAR
jgi:four helix bundle protein